MASKATKKKASTASRRVVGSMAERIDTLELDQSIAVSERFAVSAVQNHGDLLESLRQQRTTLAAYLGRINDGLDTREFKVESGVILTDDKTAMHCVAIVTRLA